MENQLDRPAAEAKTDRELLLLTAVKVHEIDARVLSQNGRLRALEKWRWLLAGAIAVITPLSPLLIYEVRQSVLGTFGG